MQDVTEATLRAVIDRDVDAYRAGVETLQPDAGPSGKTVLAIYLSKAALHVRALRDPEFEVTQATLDRAKGHHPITLNWGAAFAERFSVEESRTLWSRFEGLDASLQDDVEMFEPRVPVRPDALLLQRAAGERRRRGRSSQAGPTRRRANGSTDGAATGHPSTSRWLRTPIASGHSPSIASGRAEAEAWQRELRSSLVDLIGGFPAEAVPAIAQGDGEGRVPDLHP